MGLLATIGRWLHPLEYQESHRMPDGGTLTRLSVDPPEWRGLSEYERASLRWTQHNAERRAAGCPCGKPATEVEYDGRNVGFVPVETWTCAEHKGADGWTGRGNEARPTWIRHAPCATCTGLCMSGGRIDGPTTDWYCPDREE